MSDTNLQSPLLFRITLYQGSKGERIEEKTLLNSETDQPMTTEEAVAKGITEPLVHYTGVATMVNNIPTPYGIVQIPTDSRFSIQASSPKDALYKFEGRIAEIAQKIKEHQQKMMEEEKEELYIPSPEETQSLINSEGLKLVRE